MWAGSDVQAWDIAGLACESGDLLALAEAQAYGAAMSGTDLTRSRPAEALDEPGTRNGTDYTLIRRRKTPQDVWAAQIQARGVNLTR